MSGSCLKSWVWRFEKSDLLKGAKAGDRFNSAQRIAPVVGLDD
jgi:hypothetical protein